MDDRVPPFIQKLYHVLSNYKYKTIISWSFDVLFPLFISLGLFFYYS